MTYSFGVDWNIWAILLTSTEIFIDLICICTTCMCPMPIYYSIQIYFIFQKKNDVWRFCVPLKCWYCRLFAPHLIPFTVCSWSTISLYLSRPLFALKQVFSVINSLKFFRWIYGMHLSLWDRVKKKEVIWQLSIRTAHSTSGKNLFTSSHRHRHTHPCEHWARTHLSGLRVLVHNTSDN